MLMQYRHTNPALLLALLVLLAGGAWLIYGLMAAVAAAATVGL